MKRSYTYLLIFIFSLTSFACTSARWTVKEQSAVDSDDYILISSKEFLSTTSAVTPESPNLKLQVLSNSQYEYAQKVLVQRTIQDYKIRPGFFALGLIGSGLAAYAANSSSIIQGKSTAASVSLNLAAVIMAGAGIINMKPDGDPRLTGEERFLRKSGSVIRQDTVQVENSSENSAEVSIWYGENNLIDEEARNLQGGVLNINLGGILSGLEIEGSNTGQVKVEVQYADSTYRYEYPLEQLLLPYARVISPVAQLRSKPEQSPENILAELIEGSQLQIIDRNSSEWYKILYGISENYISRDDAELIWRSSDYSRENDVVAVPIVPFGNVDVENNIPILTGVNSNAFGLIVSNENYEEPFGKRSYAHRDGQLIKSYLENAMGLETKNIYHLKDLTAADSLYRIFNTIKQNRNDSTQVYIYLNGYGSVNSENGNYILGLKTTGERPSTINLSELFSQFSELSDDKIIVLTDIEFNPLSNEPILPESELDLKQPLRRLSRIITSDNPKATVIFGSELNQDSELYVREKGEDKKHHIFPYFFAKALQERNTNLGAIYQYLQRNIPYTSRRLHDRSQDPQIYGNTSQELIPIR